MHATFLTLSGDFLRRRFDSIDAAAAWIDERDRERELIEQLEGVGLDPKTPAAPPRTRATAPPPTPTPGAPRRRRSEPVSAWGPAGIAKAPSARARGKFGFCHLGVRRRDLLHGLVADTDAEEGESAAGRRERPAAMGGKGAEEMEIEEEL